MQRNKQDFSRKTKVTYKILFEMLSQNRVKSISVMIKDMIPFTKYITQEGFKDKIYITTKNGNAIFSTTPTAQTINKQEEKLYQNLIHQ